MPPRDPLVAHALRLATFLIALNAFIIMPALPRIVEDLGGLGYYGPASASYIIASRVSRRALAWARTGLDLPPDPLARSRLLRPRFEGRAVARSRGHGVGRSRVGDLVDVPRATVALAHPRALALLDPDLPRRLV